MRGKKFTILASTNCQILSHIFIGLNYCHVFCLDVVLFLHIPKSIGLCHFWIWFKQRGLEIWTFFCPIENHVASGRNLMLHFRFPFTTSITFCITYFRGNTVIHFGATRQQIDTLHFASHLSVVIP